MQAADRQVHIGVDIGGTFTDVMLVDGAAGRTHSAKVLTTPQDPAIAVLDAVAKVLEQAGIDIASVRSVVHGTTLATNAIIERKGARTALLTTKGFRDILETGTELRYDQYDLAITFPEPLVPRRLRLGIGERTRYDGQIVETLRASDVREALERCRRAGVESLAVCFLHAYANASNEVEAEQAIAAQWADLPVSISSRVLPQVGEYGRVSTTVVNAYVRPLVERYLGHLAEALAERGSRGGFFVMGSHGGTLTLDVAKQLPVKLVESGPAAGACVASIFGEWTHDPNMVAFDMGGTTAKICIIRDGQPTRTTEFEVARVRRFQKGSGLLLKAPAIDLIEIGAGGGSIARVDVLGLLAVGPDSAGADPGPACYGRGGTLPTVTDADLVLGYLNAAYFLGGEMRLDADRASDALRERLAEPLQLSTIEAARSVYEVVNENMANAAAVYAAEQGVDLRDYCLFAFGGAAPAHAWDTARRLSMRRVVVPAAAGVLSALGCVLSPLSFDFVVGYMRELGDVDWDHVNSAFTEMEQQGRAWLADAGVDDGIVVTHAADMRYLGQRYEVTFPLPNGEPLSRQLIPEIERAFYEAYRRHYGREIHEVPVETVAWRLTVSAPRPIVDLHAPDGRDDGSQRAGIKGTRKVFFAHAGGFVDAAVYDRYRLAPGMRISGPAVVEDRESTAVIPPDAEVTVDKYHSLVIALG